MARDSIHTELRFLFNGQELNAPLEWADIEILANFDAENPEGETVAELVQANITIEQFMFSLEGYELIQQWIADGLSGGVGIFEGIPFSIEAYNSDRVLSVFDGYINLADGLRFLPEEGKYSASVEKREGLNNIAKRIEGLTYGFLEEQGLFSESDYDDLAYIVKVDFDPLQAAFQAVVAYVLVKELAENAKDISENVATVVSFLQTGLTGPIASAFFAAASAIFQLAYSLAILSALIQLARDIINSLVPPVREHKTIKMDTLLRKVAEYLGLELVTDIEELELYHYLPSNQSADEGDSLGFLKKAGTVEKGIPNAVDYGYRVSEMFELAAKMFNARFAILGDELHLHSEGSDFWERQADYVLPDVLVESIEYNTDELYANRFISFATDVRDDYTVTDFTGTNVQTITRPIAVNDEKAVNIRGLDEVRLPVALASRNGELSGLERALQFLLEQFESLARVFGAKLNLSGVFSRKLGAMKVSNNQHSVPKIVYNLNGQIPVKHRDVLSARAIEEKFYSIRSFVQNGGKGQKIRYGQTVPFGLEDFVQVAENAYFSNSRGQSAKMIEVRWRLAGDEAQVRYYVREKYTDNLQEQTIEP